MNTLDNEAIDMVLRQAPANATREDAARALDQASGNVTNAIGLLFNVMPPAPRVAQTKWEKMREICDEHDRAAADYMNTARANTTT